MKGSLHICVIGAGLAGLACALAAAMDGVSVDVFDEQPTLARHPAHVDVVPNLLRDLVSLGVADDCVRAGFPYRGITLVDDSGRTRFDLPTPRLAPVGYPEALGIAHGEFARILARAAHARGVRLHWQTPVQALRPRGESALLRLADGRELAPDLVLLATGLRSPLRDQLWPGSLPPTRLGDDWTCALLARPRGLDGAMLVVNQAGQRAFVVPVNASTIGVALMPGGGSAPAARATPAILQPLLAHLDARTPQVVRPMLASLLPAPWHRAAVLCVGECAHALPPQLGQSAAQAFEDALVLRELLSQGLAPAVVAQRFSERRAPRAGAVFDLVCQAARSQLSPEAGTDLRDVAQRLSRIVATAA
jgi:2-polyprenyl-6-methoxyphenol hydroxylase-like FAD-dependent oxidoreductase